MNFDYTQKFIKSYKKLSQKDKDRFDERIRIFSLDEYSSLLKNHKLHGEYDGYRSINITADIRAVYKKLSTNHYLFFAVGTHSELYE